MRVLQPPAEGSDAIVDHCKAYGFLRMFEYPKLVNWMTRHVARKSIDGINGIPIDLMVWKHIEKKWLVSKKEALNLL